MCRDTYPMSGHLFLFRNKGGKTNTVIASLISTCKELGIHPRLYLEDVLTRLACGETKIARLLPDQWQPAQANMKTYSPLR
ncbi:MAG: transposase domain-containing protein [Candidatus Obscuribacterales bacterium]|nr:transposase domain-containing protein [Candidatus Obscuribacterales bacterium]